MIKQAVYLQNLVILKILVTKFVLKVQLLTIKNTERKRICRAHWLKLIETSLLVETFLNNENKSKHTGAGFSEILRKLKRNPLNKTTLK